MTDGTSAADDVRMLSRYVYERTRGRLGGLTDREYLWEPAPDCTTIRRDPRTGTYRADPPERGDLAPSVRSIAWCLWHLVGCYGSVRTTRWLGVGTPPTGFEHDDEVPATAAGAIDALERAYASWSALLDALEPAAWHEPLGSVAGPYGKSTRMALVLHQLDEQIHHGAELAVLRDLSWSAAHR